MRQFLAAVILVGGLWGHGGPSTGTILRPGQPPIFTFNNGGGTTTFLEPGKPPAYFFDHGNGTGMLLQPGRPSTFFFGNGDGGDEDEDE